MKAPPSTLPVDQESLAMEQWGRVLTFASVSDDGLPQPEAQRFRMGREIGRGGMGRVVEAVDTQFGRVVAVKELLAGGQERFSREALITGNLEHPSIPPVYARGHSEGRPYFAMRYVRGRTLAEVLFDTRSLVERLRFLPAIVATANALGYAHARGVIHRDVKPANVLLGSHGETILLDWGLGKLRGLSLPEPEGAVREGTQTRDGAVLGTPSYMAPEQARGELSAMDERTDVFALGAMLYHLLTGKPPYEAGRAEDIILAAAACLPRPVRALEPQAPLGLVDICTRAMQAKPEDRYPNAVAFAEAIQAAQAAALLPAPPAQVRHLTAGVVATGALLFVGVILIATRVGAPLASQGIGVWAVLAFSLPVFLFQGLDWYFGERWPFRNLSRGLMVAALAGGLSVSISNVVATLETVRSAEGASLTLLLQGLGEALPGAGLALGLFSLQVLLSSWISWERERQ